MYSLTYFLIQNTTIMENIKPDVIETNGVSPNPTYINIIGSQSIDLTIINLCPDIISASQKTIIMISRAIKSYLFNNEPIISIISEITNEATADFIEGMRIIIREESITDIQGIENHIIGMRSKRPICI